jgi:signal peptidase I
MIGRIVGLALIALAAAWFITLRPQFLGGPTAYILVTGESMEPTLHSGSLVVVVGRPQYEVGEIVAYRIPPGGPAAGRNVIHRITGGSAESGFIMRGDNTSGSDLWRPKPADILGSTRVVIPGAMPAVLFLRSPMVVASLAAGFAVYLILGLWTNQERRVEPAT